MLCNFTSIAHNHHTNIYFQISNIIIFTLMQTRIRVDETETTNLVLKVVEVAEKNGLRLPREFGLLMKQVLYFDRYQKILAPDFDPMASIQAVDGSGGSSRGSIDGSGPFAVIDTTAVDLDLD